MPTRRRGYRSSNGAKRLKREVYWVRGAQIVPASTQTFSYNLAGMALNDPAVKALIRSGVPDLYAYDKDATVLEGTTHMTTYFQVTCETPLRTDLRLGIIKAQVPNTAGTDFPVPNPGTHANQSDWLFWTVANPTIGNTVNDPAAALTARWSRGYQAKSKRRTTEGNETFYIVGDLGAPLAASGESVTVIWATLFATPILTR